MTTLSTFLPEVSLVLQIKRTRSDKWGGDSNSWNAVTPADGLNFLQLKSASLNLCHMLLKKVQQEICESHPGSRVDSLQQECAAMLAELTFCVSKMDQCQVASGSLELPQADSGPNRLAGASRTSSG